MLGWWAADPRWPCLRLLLLLPTRLYRVMLGVASGRSPRTLRPGFRTPSPRSRKMTEPALSQTGSKGAPSAQWGESVMGKPSVATQKRLFAVSGNRCAYRNCPQNLVDEASGKVAARICHIKGNKKGSARYEENQPEAERQGFKNLILMCPYHHDVIDSDEKMFTVEMLQILKAEHEVKGKSQQPPDEQATERFLANVNFDSLGGPMVLAANVASLQLANTIHNNYGTAPEHASTFRNELAARHLADPDDPEFGRTIHQRKMGDVGQDGQIHPLRTTALLVAYPGQPLITKSREAEVLRWMDVNKRRYEPCNRYGFIPGVAPDRSGSALLWHDAGMMRASPTASGYRNYLALDKSGLVEFGFHPSSFAEKHRVVYYAKTLARVVGFLGFLQDLATFLKIDSAVFSLGVALQGTKGVDLACITQRVDAPLIRQLIHTVLPARENLLYLRPSEKGPWELDEVAHEVAEAMLEHWSCTRPGWIATPEFKDGEYTGEFFKNNFISWG